MGPTKKGSEQSRAERKANKRKLEDAIPDLPGDNENEVNDGEVEVKEERKSKKLKTKDTSEEKAKKSKKTETESIEPAAEEGDLSKKDKKKKKSKRSSEEEGEEKAAATTGDVDAIMAELVGGNDEEAPKKSKKERKAERKAKEAAEKAASTTPAQATASAQVEEKVEGDATKPSGQKSKNNNRNRDKKRKEKAAQKDGTEKDARFIVFIGNLPYSATTESVTKHFASVKPKSVRHLTQKDNPTKSKGIAFVEFDGYDHMKTCLKLFHHSMFDDGISPARKINAELTAGGGGNTKDRKAKIQDKNAKLNDQRTRRIQEEEKAKFEKKKDGADESAIHPSRRARVPGAS